MKWHSMKKHWTIQAWIVDPMEEDIVIIYFLVMVCLDFLKICLSTIEKYQTSCLPGDFSRAHKTY